MTDNEKTNFQIISDIMIQEIQAVRESVKNIDDKLDTRLQKVDEKIDSRLKWKVFAWITGFIIFSVVTLAGTVGYNSITISKVTINLEHHIKNIPKKLDKIEEALNGGGKDASNESR